MCVVNAQVNEVRQSLRKMKEMNDLLHSKLSEKDKIVNELYHQIEQGKYGTVQGYKKIKALQKALRERRVIKQEIFKLKPVIELINDKKVLNSFDSVGDKIRSTEKKNQQYVAGWDVSLEDVFEFV